MSIERKISNLIASQFPTFYREEAPTFIAFVKSYYEWAEQVDNFIGVGRGLQDHRDVDRTLDEFLQHFRNEYLCQIPDWAVVDKRLLVKHVLDLYRAKGTPRAYELLFRILFDEEIQLFIPGEFLLRPSDGKWTILQYIEVQTDDRLDDMIGKRIIGSGSGATAVVESHHEKLVSGYVIDVLGISSVIGSFTRGEILVCEEASVSAVDGPMVLGSLTSIGVENGGIDFRVGDILSIEGATTYPPAGIGATAVVTSTGSSDGKVKFTLIGGGSGYSMNAEVVVTGGYGGGATFQVGGLVNKETYVISTDLITDYYLTTLDTQTAGFNVHVTGVSGGPFTAGEYVWSTANVTSMEVSTITTANLAVGESLSNGSTWTAKVVKQEDTLLIVSAPSAAIAPGQTLTGGTTSAQVLVISTFPAETLEANAYVQSYGSTTLYLTNCLSYSSSNWIVDSIAVSAPGGGYTNGEFMTFSGAGTGGGAVIMETSNTGNVISVAVRDSGTGYTSAPTVNQPVGTAGSGATFAAAVKRKSGYFVPGAVVHGSTSGALGTVTTVSRNTNWNFPKVNSPDMENLDTSISNTLTTRELTVGTISFITHANPGTGYSTDPTVEVIEPDIYNLREWDPIMGGYKGYNAIVTAVAGMQTGIVTSISLQSSGYGYWPDEDVVLSSANNSSSVTGRAVILSHGRAAGYWADRRGFISDQMMIQDSYYYQEHSYEIVAARMKDTYEKAVKSLVHPCGLAMFGAFALRGEVDSGGGLMMSSLTQL